MAPFLCPGRMGLVVLWMWERRERNHAAVLPHGSAHHMTVSATTSGLSFPGEQLFGMPPWGGLGDSRPPMTRMGIPTEVHTRGCPCPTETPSCRWSRPVTLRPTQEAPCPLGRSHKHRHSHRRTRVRSGHTCCCVCVRASVRVCFTFLAGIHSGNLSRKERVNVAIIRDKLIPDM